MNKSRILLIITIAIVVTLVAIAVTFFALRKSSDAYASCLPYDATSITRLDAKSFLSAAKLGPKDLLDLLRRTRDNQDSHDTQSLGIDVMRPIYAFSSATGNFGIVAAMDDIDDFEAFLEEESKAGRASEITRQRGFSWATIGEQWLLAFDKEKALAMGPAVGAAQDQLRNEMARLMEQEKKDSGLQSSIYEELKKSDEPLAAIVAPEILPDATDRFLKQFSVSSKNDALLRISLETDDNELEMDADIIAKSPAVKDHLNRINQLMRPIKGSQLNYAHADNVAWMALNVQGSELLDVLRSNQTVRTALIALNLVLDLDRIIRAIDGDVALELTSTDIFDSSDIQIKHLYLTADVANSDFLSNASTWGNQLIGVQALTQQDFAVNLGTSSVYFGVDKNTLYISGERGLTKGDNAYLNDERSDIRDSRFYATVALPQVISRLGANTDLPAAVNNFQRLVFEMEDAGEFKLKLIAPRGMNIARELLLAE